jgi:hypothetical protein
MCWWKVVQQQETSSESDPIPVDRGVVEVGLWRPCRCAALAVHETHYLSERWGAILWTWGDNFSPRMPCQWYLRRGGEGKRRILIGHLWCWCWWPRLPHYSIHIGATISPLVPRRHMCAAYIDKFVENWVLKISQFCFLGIVPLCIGLNFHKSKVWKL